MYLEAYLSNFRLTYHCNPAKSEGDSLPSEYKTFRQRDPSLKDRISDRETPLIWRVLFS